MSPSFSEKIAFIEKVFGPARLSRTTRNLEVMCPICAPSDKTKKKLAILLDDDRTHCWVCGFKARSLVTLIKKYGTSEQLRTYYEKFMPKSTRSNKAKETSASEPVVLPSDFSLVTLANMASPDFRVVKNYCCNRGMSERDLWYYKIGCSVQFKWKRRAIVPSFDKDGKLNYYVGRTVDKEIRPKYSNLDVDKSTIIFNEMNVDWSKQLVLCEGAFDMFKCGDNAVPLLGSDLNEESLLFNTILVHRTPIALALDGDMWVKKTPKVVKKLVEYDIPVVVVDTRPFDDPGKASKQQFQDALAVASMPSWEETFFDRLTQVTKSSLRV